MAETRTHEIKVNLPASSKEFETGIGEGVWVLVDDATEAAYVNDVDKSIFRGTLDNMPLHWSNLTPGDELVLEMRGKNRPVVPYGWLCNTMSE